jgi:hypothetical protein
MPSRRRPKSPANPTRETFTQPPAAAAKVGSRAVPDVERDLERFAAALKDSAQADAAARQRVQQQRADAARMADEAAAHDRALVAARRDLQRAVEAVRHSKEIGRGRAEADAAWKIAKARLIELETGAAPAWAPKPAAPEPGADPDSGAPAELDDDESAAGHDAD